MVPPAGAMRFSRGGGGGCIADATVIPATAASAAASAATAAMPCHRVCKAPPEVVAAHRAADGRSAIDSRGVRRRACCGACKFA
eukprot:362814-Chlamydomonas_euryale.AAC.6